MPPTPEDSPWSSSSRLIHTGSEGGSDFVEVSHEALIREWPTFRIWVAQNREDLRLERGLLESAAEWQRLDRDPEALMRGARLVQAEDLLQRCAVASELARDFVSVSAASQAAAERREHEARERELAQQRELRQQAVARAEAEARSALRFRRFSMTLAGLLFAAVGALVLARRQQLIAESRALAVQAAQTHGYDQPAALSLAMQAWRTAHTAEARNAVAESLPQVITTLQGHTRMLVTAEFSPDGTRILTTSDDGTARISNASTGRLLKRVDLQQQGLNHGKFSHNGRLALLIGHNYARVLDVASGQLLATLRGRAGAFFSAEFSPDDTRIVTTNRDNTARVLDAVSLQPLLILQGHSGPVWDAVYSPQGRQILTASEDHTARVWDATSGGTLAILRAPSAVGAAVFSPDGRLIAARSADHTVRILNARAATCSRACMGLSTA